MSHGRSAVYQRYEKVGWRLLLAAVLVGGVASADTGDAQKPARITPDNVVRRFYARHFSHNMAFTKASVDAKAAWLTPDLLALCRAYLAKPQSPDEVPDINGDPFTDSQEYPKSFRVRPPVVSGSTAKVPVVFAWPTRSRTVTVELVEQDGTWRINDIAYGDSGTLRQLLASSS